MLGTRRSELLCVRWADIDLKQRTLRLPETKAGRPHFLPFYSGTGGNALSIPAESRQSPNGRSHPAVRTDISSNLPKAWQRIRERAGVKARSNP